MSDLTPDLIGETLGEYDGLFCATDSDTLAFEHKGSGELLVTLWRWDDHKGEDVEVDLRRFRLVEVES